MFMIGATAQTVEWQAAGITLDLMPLDEATDQQFIKETTTETRGDDGRLLDIQRDIPKYAQLVGRHCIKGWRKVVDAQRNTVACSAQNIDQFMLIGPAQDFVFGKVKGISLHLAEEEVDAGED